MGPRAQGKELALKDRGWDIFPPEIDGSGIYPVSWDCLVWTCHGLLI